MSQADHIRDYIHEHYIQNLKVGEQVKIRAGDVHRAMGLQSRMPNVCSVLDGAKLAGQCCLKLTRRIGPRQGANVYFTFVLQDTASPHQKVETKVLKKTDHKSGIKKSSPRTTLSRAHLPDDAICLVSCVGKKRLGRMPAKDLYVSDWFLKARYFVEFRDFPWFILSAKHGLVDPDESIAPYEKTLNTMGVKDRREWADRVLGQIRESIPRSKPLIFLAGQRYREYLVEPLTAAGSEIYIPMEGLTIGRQLSWLQSQVE